MKFEFYLRRKALDKLKSLALNMKNNQEIQAVLKPDWELNGWHDSGPYEGGWHYKKIPAIKSDHLKGTRLSVYGSIDWNDQGWGYKKGHVRL